jgi:hypothetical protein
MHTHGATVRLPDGKARWLTEALPLYQPSYSNSCSSRSMTLENLNSLS